MISFHLESYLFCSVDILAALIFLSLVLWPKKTRIESFVNAGVGVTFIFFLYLLFSGGTNGNGFIWSLTFPLFAFFLLGCKQGFWVSCLFFFGCLVIIFYDSLALKYEIYQFGFGFRYLFAFLLVFLFSFFYEFFRWNSEKKFRDLANNLEELVEERTDALASEFNKSEQLNKSLDKAKNEWEKTFDAVSAQICIVDINLKVTRINKSMAERIGLSPEVIVGQFCYNILEGLKDFPTYSPQSKPLKNKADYSTEIYCDNSGKYSYITVSPMYDDLGIYSGFVYVAHDITSLKLAQEKLEKSRKIEAIGRIAGGVAHDLNNILSGVVSYPQLLLLKTSKDNPLYEPMKSIQESGQRASAVVSDLLTITRGVSIPKQVTIFNNIVKEYFESIEFETLVKYHPNIKFSLDIDNTVMTVECIPTHIHKMLMNLVTNAMEAVDKNGEVYVTLKKKEAFENGELRSVVHLMVRDTGCGIKEDEFEDIFEPFYSQKKVGKSGTGLGLAIVKNIADEHDALLTVKSNAEDGTVFEFELPICDESINGRVPHNNEVGFVKGTGTILIIDDDHREKSIASQMLEFLGYNILRCSTAEEALELLSNHSPNLVFIEQVMNNSFNGFEIYQAMKSRSANLKAIMTTGYLTSDIILQTQKHGIDHVLDKPYSIESLGESVQKVMHS